MISLETAQKLKQAGLKWVPEVHDFFAIPDRNLDDRVFVISDMLVTIEELSGMQIVSFQGASEWALDYLATIEAVWIPREDQLRRGIEELQMVGGETGVQLSGGLGGYRCDITYGSQLKRFSADEASEAYAAALLYLLEHD